MQGWCVNKYSLRPDQTHRYAPVDIMLNCTVSSTVTEVSRKKHAAVPSQTTLQPADMHGTPKSLFPCDKCDKQYTQPQGVTRHQREAHEVSLCPICNDFRWSRRYQLTEHLKVRHPDINLDATLYEVTSCRREATMNKKHLQQQQASPAIECDRRSHGEPLLRSLTHTLPAVAKDSHVSLPAMLSMAYGTHPEHAVKPVTSCKREDARGLDLLVDPTINAPSASSSSEERPQPVNDAGMSVQHGQVWLVFFFFGWHIISDP
jgi:Zinc finger, C2H2 type